MSTAHIVVVGVTIVANAGMAIADLTRVGFVLRNGDEVGVPRSWVPALAALKAAGAAGLLLGLLGVPVIGLAAAVGLIGFFVGAVVTHVRARVFYNIAFPGAYLALAAASLALSIADG
jgi:hypothetical protein